MYKRYLRNIASIALCLIFVFVYYRASDNNEDTSKKTTTNTNYQTVVFKDSNDTLIPISVDVKVNDDQETTYRSMIETMKSNDYESLGLYPILSNKLEIKGMDINNNILNIDFNDALKVSNNQEALDIFESLSYMFCNDAIDQVGIKIDGEQVSTLENSTINTNCINRNLGINNFDSVDNELSDTTSVLVYNAKTINGSVYYVPVSTRVSSAASDLSSKVSLLIDNIDYDKTLSTVEQSNLVDGILSVYLDSNILVDDQSIDTILYQRLVKSLTSIDSVDTVHLYINDQLVEDTKNVNGLIDNRIKL